MKNIAGTARVDPQEKSRPGLVWVALVLQSIAFALAVWGTVQMLFLWPRLATHGVRMAPIVARSLAEAVMFGISLVGLWKAKRWGWSLAVAANCIPCFLILSSVFPFPGVWLRSPQFIVIASLDFISLGILLHHSVRRHFWSKKDAPTRPSGRGLQTVREINWAQRSFLLLIYFVLSSLAAWMVLAFSWAVMMGTKVGGWPGFFYLLVIFFPLGGAVAFIFVLVVTLIVRMLDASRLAPWLLVGGGLALGMISLTMVSRAGTVSWPILLLASATGIVSAFICYLLYPWGWISGPAT